MFHFQDPPAWLWLGLIFFVVPAAEWIKVRLERKRFSLFDLFAATTYCAVATIIFRQAGMF